MSEEVHHYHHDDPRVTVDLKVAHTTRGDTWEVEVKGAAGPDQAVTTFVETRRRLTSELEPAHE
jgi:hypothetical protein